MPDVVLCFSLLCLHGSFAPFLVLKSTSSHDFSCFVFFVFLKGEFRLPSHLFPPCFLDLFVLC